MKCRLWVVCGWHFGRFWHHDILTIGQPWQSLGSAPAVGASGGLFAPASHAQPVLLEEMWQFNCSFQWLDLIPKGLLREGLRSAYLNSISTPPGTLHCACTGGLNEVEMSMRCALEALLHPHLTIYIEKTVKMTSNLQGKIRLTRGKMPLRSGPLRSFNDWLGWKQGLFEKSS